MVVIQRAPCTDSLLWIPLLAASVNPEETPLFRKELTEETHKVEGETVRGGEESDRGSGREEALGHNLRTRVEDKRGKNLRRRARCDVSIIQQPCSCSLPPRKLRIILQRGFWITETGSVRGSGCRWEGLVRIMQQ